MKTLTGIWKAKDGKNNKMSQYMKVSAPVCPAKPKLPKMPNRRHKIDISFRREFDDSYTLKDLLDKIPQDCDLSKVNFDIRQDEDGYMDCNIYSRQFKNIVETDEQWKDTVEKYNIRLEEYNNYYLPRYKSQLNDYNNWVKEKELGELKRLQNKYSQK